MIRFILYFLITLLILSLFFLLIILPIDIINKCDKNKTQNNQKSPHIKHPIELFIFKITINDHANRDGESDPQGCYKGAI